MQENWQELANTFNPLESSVLATIVNTQGATYQKIGTMMLINQQGKCSGLLSGGCLEADIALHAANVLENGLTQVLHYDLSSDADLLWGLGLGCEGKIDILLMPLTPKNNHLGFADMLSQVLSGQSGYFFQKIAKNSSPQTWFCEDQYLAKNEKSITEQFSSNEVELIKIPVKPPLSLLICGAGPDAAPVVKFAHELGWQVSLWDHRRQSLAQVVFDEVHSKRKVRAEHTQAEEFSKFQAAVVMTHNLENDQEYLAKLTQSNIEYIGVLGPAARRDKLLTNIGLSYQQVSSKVFGPIGLDIGGRSPQAIALSIVAQIQQQCVKFATQPAEKPEIIKFELAHG